MADTPSGQERDMELAGETDSEDEPEESSEDSSESESASESEDGLDIDQGLGRPARRTVHPESETSDYDDTNFGRYGTDESAEEVDSDDDAHDLRQYSQRRYGDDRRSMEPETGASDGRESSDSDSETENEMRVPGTSVDASTLTLCRDVEPESETEQDWRAPDESAVGTLTSSDDGSSAEDEPYRPRGNYDDDRMNCDTDSIRDTEGGERERDGQELVTGKRRGEDLQQSQTAHFENGVSRGSASMPPGGSFASPENEAGDAPWVKTERYAKCKFPECIYKDKVSGGSSRLHYHSTCHHRHTKGPKAGMTVHYSSLKEMRDHHRKCTDMETPELSGLDADLWIVREKGEPCPSTECIYKSGRGRSTVKHYHGTCDHRHKQEQGLKVGMIVHYNRPIDAQKHQQQHHSGDVQAGLEKRRRGKFEVENMGLDKDLWVVRHEGEPCPSEQCIFKDESTGKSLQRHYHATCNHRHLRGRQKGMLFHHNHVARLREHEQLHKKSTQRAKGPRGGKGPQQKPAEATEDGDKQAYHAIALKGCTQEGELDDLDFTLEAIPVQGGVDPGPGSSRKPWCQWVVRSVGFFPPRGRPGKAQVAGLRPGDELTRLSIPNTKRVVWAAGGTNGNRSMTTMAEAGKVGRDLMRQALRRLSERPRPTANVRSDVGDGDSRVSGRAEETTGGSSVSIAAGISASAVVATDGDRDVCSRSGPAVGGSPSLFATPSAQPDPGALAGVDQQQPQHPQHPQQPSPQGVRAEGTASSGDGQGLAQHNREHDGEKWAGAQQTSSIADAIASEDISGWRLEFRRPVEIVAAAAVVVDGGRGGRGREAGLARPEIATSETEAAGALSRPRPGRRRSRAQPGNASLSFTVFREVRWAADGGRLFTVHVEEKSERDAVRPAPPVPGRQWHHNSPRKNAVNVPTSQNHDRRNDRRESQPEGPSSSSPTQGSTGRSSAINRSQSSSTDRSSKERSTNVHAGDTTRLLTDLLAFEDRFSAPGTSANSNNNSVGISTGTNVNEDDGSALRLLGLSAEALSTVRQRVGLAPLPPAPLPAAPPPLLLDRRRPPSRDSFGDGDFVAGGERDPGGPATKTSEMEFVSSSIAVDGRRKTMGGAITEPGPAPSTTLATAAAAIATRDGEERVTLRLSCSHNVKVTVAGACSDCRGRCRGPGRGYGLLDGLMPAAVELVKERIFAAARVEYARLYGLRRSRDQRHYRGRRRLHLQWRSQALATDITSTVAAATPEPGRVGRPSNTVDPAAREEPSRVVGTPQAVDAARALLGLGEALLGEREEAAAVTAGDIDDAGRLDDDCKVLVREAGAPEKQQQQQLSERVSFLQGQATVGESGISDKAQAQHAQQQLQLRLREESSDAAAATRSSTPSSSSSSAEEGSLRRPGSGALRESLQEFVRKPAFCAWVAELRDWSASQPAFRVCNAAAGCVESVENRGGKVGGDKRNAGKDPFNFFVAWRPVEIDGRLSSKRYAAVFPSDSEEALKLPGVQQVTIPAFPDCTTNDSDPSTTAATATRGGDLRLAVTSASARLFPLWERSHRNNNNNISNRNHRQEESEDRGGGRGEIRFGDGVNRDEVRGGGGVNYPRGDAAGHGEELGDGRDSGNCNEESPPEPSDPKGKRLRGSPDRNPEQTGVETQPSPVPPPPPTREFSAAVNKLLQGALLAPPGGAGPRVERMPEKIYRKLRHNALIDKGKDEAGAGAGIGWSKCFVCRLPVTSGCACGALELARERAFWHGQVANASGRPLQIHLAESQYNRRVPSDRHGRFLDEVANRRTIKVNPNRLDQNVSLQHRGLLRLFPTSTLTSVTPPDGNVGANPDDGHKQPYELPVQRQQQQKEVPFSSTAEALPPSGGNLVTSGETVSVSVGATTIDQEPPDQATRAAIKLGKRPCPSSVSAPRLEKWPGFATPSQAYARAAPLEAPAGLLPPSRRFLGYIHQVASLKVEATPELYGTLDESALIAVGVLVEEMLEELVSPLVDRRTKGYKHLNSASLDRELAFYHRMSVNRRRQGITTAHRRRPPAIVSQGDEQSSPLSTPQTSSQQSAALPSAVPSDTRYSNGNGGDTGSLGDGGTVAGEKQQTAAFHRQEVLGRFGKGSGDSQGMLTEDQQAAMGKALQCVFGTLNPFRFSRGPEAGKGGSNVGETEAEGGTRSHGPGRSDDAIHRPQSSMVGMVRGNRRLTGDKEKVVHREPREILRHPRLQGRGQWRVGGSGGMGGRKTLVRSDEQARGMDSIAGVNGQLRLDSSRRGGKQPLVGVVDVGRNDLDGGSSGSDDDDIDRGGEEEAAVRAEAKAKEQEMETLKMHLRKKRRVAAGERGRADGVEYVRVDDMVLSDDGKEMHEEGLTEESAEWEAESDSDQESDA